jgi:hypothetical protein
MWRRRKQGREPARPAASFDIGVVAHATPAELAFLAISGDVDAIQPPPWRRAVGYLADRLLERHE